jgi:FtsP/CotA-like multicopper oxidase with cupredoxin domain
MIDWVTSTFVFSKPASHGEQHDVKAVKQLAIPLYPDAHIYRAPTVLFFNWTITSAIRYPDGVAKRVYLANGDFPGQTIEARSGDELRVTVHNQLTGSEEEELGVSLHWHGLRLAGGQNVYDGAAGFTQCPIVPGRSFTYRVKVGDEEHGTFWWHAHAQGQRGDGLFGGLVVHRPVDGMEAEVPRPNETLLMIGDWFHASAKETLDWYTGYQHFGAEPVPDSMLVNGRGRFDCSALPTQAMEASDCREVTDFAIGGRLGRATRWRIINVGSIAGLTLAVQGANVSLLQVDGGSNVKPRDAGDAFYGGVGILYPGERVDLQLDWIETVSDANLFISLDDENFAYTNPSLARNQSFAISNPPINSAADMSTEPQQVKTIDMGSLAALSPSQIVPPKATHTLLVYVKTQILAKFANQPMAFINHTSWQPQMPPLILLPRDDWDANQLVPHIPLDSDDGEAPWVDLVINNLDDGSHPFHLHGHHFYVLSRHRAEGRGGWGSFNPFTVDSGPPSGVNLVDPVRKDTIAVPRRGHVVLRFRADNRGLWMLHCHMLVHLGSGMAMGLQVGGEEDSMLGQVDDDVVALCTY